MFRASARCSLSTLLLLACLTGGGPAVSAFSAESPALILHPAAQVRGDGVFLHQLVANTNALPALPNVRLANAPAFGKSFLLTKDHIMEAWRRIQPEAADAWKNWAGAARIHVTRQARALEAEEVQTQITRLLQEGHVRSKGTLELRLTRPWIPVGVPIEPIEFHITDLPATGVSPFFILRFEIRTKTETVGLWQVPLQAKVWRNIWVARSGIRRGQVFTDADVVQERRDVLGLREAPLSIAQPDYRLEIAENLVAGAPLMERSVRARPVVRRGQIVEAQLINGLLVISLKVELLEDGAPGQVVRVRNMNTKREFRGKVYDESTVVVAL